MSAMSLWGDDFKLPDKKKEAKKIIKKIETKPEITIEKTLRVKNTKVPLEEKLRLITAEVYRILGVYKEQTQVIHTREELHKYIDAAISNNCIAVDTETNNSLDPITCKLMGGCIYTPGQKNAYIPINHVDKEGNKLANQLSEQDIFEEFSRLENTFTIFHNGKFDYQVIKCTCGLAMNICWDTMIGAKILNENELSAGLKQQYIEKIDSSIEKYNIEHLFKDVEYAIVDPDVFALYAATDSYMTYKLYEWQKKQFVLSANKGIMNLFQNIEMPLVHVIAEMEMAGMDVDQEYGDRLSQKYHQQLDEVETNINEELAKLHDKIEKWRLTPDANYHPPKKTGEGYGKSKAEQLVEPVNTASPTQLAILLYDVLNAPCVNKKSPRGTGAEEIETINKKLNLPLLNLILKQRELNKLLSTYIDSIPELARRWPDGRVRTHFQQYGAATGRLSSCISKGTLVATPHGDIPIEDIKVGDWVYCYDESNKLKLSKVKNWVNNGFRDCVKLYWKSKYTTKLTGELICTPDHFIKTSIGWVMAKDIKPEYSIPYVHHRYNEDSPSIYGYLGQGAEEEHIWVRDNYFDIIKKVDDNNSSYDIHHADVNRFNNDPDNLIYCSKKVHINQHMAMENGYNGSYNFTKEQLIEMGNSVNWVLESLPYDYFCIKNWMRNYRINFIQKYTESYSVRKYNVDEKGRLKKFRHLPLRKDNLLYAMELADTLSEAAGFFGVSEEEFKVACDKYELLTNHNVYKIEYLEEQYEVYDLEVETYHNFIAGELCVHNCDPLNFQNIPSHNKAIRLLFKAAEGNKIVGGDFSAQEPRLTAFYSGDENMINAYKEGKDLYAIIASKSFDKPYEDCLEFYPEGTEIEVDGKKIICGHKTNQNKAGKERRTQAKSILLGVLYGRGAASIGEQIGKSYQEAQDIVDSFFTSFPAVKKWINGSIESAHKLGYVEDVAGRRRRLPDAMLQPYDIKTSTSDFNPILESKNIISPVNKELIDKYYNKLTAARSNKEREAIKADAVKEGVTIKDNGGYIAQAERQAVNSRVQGGAATLTKCALIELYNNEQLRKIGARLVNTVHDEILMEVPSEHADECADLLCSIMKSSAKKLVPTVPMSVDAYIVNHWYEDEMSVALQKEFKGYVEKTNDHEKALSMLYNAHEEFLTAEIDRMLSMT